MKIVFTGGGTGGHFYPLMAVAEQILKETYAQKLVQPKLYYYASSSYNDSMLYERGIVYTHIPSGKLRLYFSLENIIDMFKVIAGTLKAICKLLIIYPDVVFAKGGYDSVPTSVAAWILRIPIIIHDSDTITGRANLFISRFATRIAVSYPESVKNFKNESTVACTGQPIIEKYLPDANFTRAYNDGKLQRQTILITGGSQGSVKINDCVLEILPELISKYNVIHHTGALNIEDVEKRVSVILHDYDKSSYTAKANLDFSTIYPHVDLAISRAGSTLFEFASWQIPSIVIPIPEDISRDQVSNAQAAERAGFVKVLLENNLTPHVLLADIEKILGSQGTYEHMAISAKNFNNPHAANTIAKEILSIVLLHA
jgi:UDP-N-acetylglucosamine--N-acetylmuramyl-(pentapeptide) pyrophosphoryl-undecaprenol N-acetylglucosamine transferase